MTGADLELLVPRGQPPFAQVDVVSASGTVAEVDPNAENMRKEFIEKVGSRMQMPIVLNRCHRGLPRSTFPSQPIGYHTNLYTPPVQNIPLATLPNFQPVTILRQLHHSVP